MKSQDPTGSRITSRARQQQTLRPSDFAIYGSHFERLTANISVEATFADAMRPGFWAYVAPSLQADKMRNAGDRTGSVIELRRQDNAFYAELYVKKVWPAGLEVVCIGPSFDPQTGEACPLDLETGLPWSDFTREVETPPSVPAERKIVKQTKPAKKITVEQPEPEHGQAPKPTFELQQKPTGEEYRITWNTKHRGFDIFRMSDNELVADAVSFPNKGEALDWVRSIGGIVR
jgi:hypothetical protein